MAEVVARIEEVHRLVLQSDKFAPSFFLEKTYRWLLVAVSIGPTLSRFERLVGC